MQTTISRNLRRAMDAASLGLPVFPCRHVAETIMVKGKMMERKAKSPLTDHGYKDATTDPAKVFAYWTQYPDALVSAATGAVSGISVVDIDRKNGKDGFASLAKIGLDIRSRCTIATPSGGEHRFFRHPPGMRVASNSDILKALVGRPETGIDTRGDCGSIILYGDLTAEMIATLPDWPAALVDAIHRDRAMELDRVKAKAIARGSYAPDGPADVERICAALKFIPADDRDDWLHVGMALHAELGDGGRPTWDAWSATSTKFDEGDQHSTWRSFKGHAIGIGTLFHLAKSNGWNTRTGKSGGSTAQTQTSSSSSGKSAPTTSPAVVISRRANTIKPTAISWLWPGRFARGKISLLGGMPGLGKSQLICHLAAIVTTGGEWPNGEGRCEVGNVVILNAEDDAADTIVPRLIAAGADLNRIEIVEAVRDGEDRRPVSLKSDLAALGTTIEKMGGASLVPIDPISAYLGAVDSHKNAEVRALLAPLADWTMQHRVATVGLTHLNKGSDGSAMARFMGSMGFIAAARTGFLVTPDSEDASGDRRLLLPAKNNIARKLPGLAFTIEGVILPSEVGEIETSRLVWAAGAVDMTADEALGSSSTGDDDAKHSAREYAEKFLRIILKDGPKNPKWVQDQAKECCIAEITLRRARENIKVEVSKCGMTGGWLWSLPAPKMIIDAEDDRLPEMSTFGADDHLRSTCKSENITDSTIDGHLADNEDDLLEEYS